jgi:hypothetical protein
VTDEPGEQLTLNGEAERERWEREGFDGWDVFADWKPSPPRRGEEGEFDDEG